MQRYLTNNFSQSESFQPLERIHFNNLIQPLETGSTIGFFQPLGLAKIGKKIQSIEILFQPLEIPTIEIGENTSFCDEYKQCCHSFLSQELKLNLPNNFLPDTKLFEKGNNVKLF